jgi:hypothetical protein
VQRHGSISRIGISRIGRLGLSIISSPSARGSGRVSAAFLFEGIGRALNGQPRGMLVLSK